MSLSAVLLICQPPVCSSTSTQRVHWLHEAASDLLGLFSQQADRQAAAAGRQTCATACAGSQRTACCLKHSPNAGYAACSSSSISAQQLSQSWRTAGGGGTGAVSVCLGIRAGRDLHRALAGLVLQERTLWLGLLQEPRRKGTVLLPEWPSVELTLAASPSLASRRHSQRHHKQGSPSENACNIALCHGEQSTAPFWAHLLPVG